MKVIGGYESGFSRRFREFLRKSESLEWRYDGEE